MHTRPRLIGATAALATALWHVAASAGAKSCSYIATYPSAIGRHAFMLGTATARTVAAPIDTPYVYARRAVPAQLMAVSDVAGYQAEAIRRGLHASGGTAVFVRYRIGQGCGPDLAPDGALDSAGVNGLYVGVPRATDRWVDGRPTFDIFRAPHYPLPQRLSGPSGHLVITRQDPTPTMTASELFAMYRALWAESVSPGDTSVERRIRRWIASNPGVARKQTAKRVATEMLMALTDTAIALQPIPFGGTFAITVVVAGTDSLVLYGRTPIRARLFANDVTTERITGVPVAMSPRSFAIDITTSMSLAGLSRSSLQINPCPPIAVVVDALPIVPDADSTWRGEMYPASFLDCAPPGSTLAGFTRQAPTPGFNSGPTSVTFRRHADGRITFDARTAQDSSRGIVVHGERVSSEFYGQ
jgi:hypothetical protein